MIEIIGHALSQWDVGRSVQITGIEAEYAHIANKGDSKAVIMGVVDSEAKIPDYLLQTGKQLCVYAVKDGITVESKTFYVQKRERPENYVYEDDERNYIYKLLEKVEDSAKAANQAAEAALAAAENADNATDAANQVVQDAKRFVKTVNGVAPDENGNVDVEVGSGGIVEENDPTVPEWAKQPQKPSYTAQEVGALPADTVIPAPVTDEHINALIDAKLAELPAVPTYTGEVEVE